MERSASVANIKCVNSNLLGIWNSRLPQLGLIAEDRGRCQDPLGSRPQVGVALPAASSK
jgi:hypothetical protein